MCETGGGKLAGRHVQREAGFQAAKKGEFGGGGELSVGGLK